MGIAKTKLDSTKIERVMMEFLREIPAIPELNDIRLGSRNAKINPSESIYAHAPLSVKDLSALGRTRMRIEIFVEKVNGFKNSTRMTDIFDTIVVNFEDGLTLSDYNFQFIDTIDGEDNQGFDFKFINLEVLIT